jgi:MinD-like ATPase involved in chromosome partitioning or flagellar assembly
VPDDIAVPISVNAGVPVVIEEPRAPVSRALEVIADSLLGPQLAGGKHKRRKRGE